MGFGGTVDFGIVAAVFDGTVRLTVAEGRLTMRSCTSFLSLFEATQKSIRLNHRRKEE